MISKSIRTALLLLLLFAPGELRKYRVTIPGHEPIEIDSEAPLKIEVTDITPPPPPPPPRPKPTPGVEKFAVPADGTWAQAFRAIADNGVITVSGQVEVTEPAMLGLKSGAGPVGVKIYFEPGALLIDKTADDAPGPVLFIGTPDCEIYDFACVGRFAPHGCIKGHTTAHNLKIDGLDVSNFARHCIDVDGNNTRITNFEIHHILWYDTNEPPKWENRRLDAHGIVTKESNGLYLGQGKIWCCSGDAFQADRGARWNNVVIEDCEWFDMPLETDIGGFSAGIRVGENAIDTKTTTITAATPRRNVTTRRCHFYGFGKGTGEGPEALIAHSSACNIKEGVVYVSEDDYIHDCEIAFRLRGSTNGLKIAPDIHNCRIENCQFAIRAEDKLQDFTFQNNTLRTCTEYWRKVPGSQPWDYLNYNVRDNTIIDPDAVDKTWPVWPFDVPVIGKAPLTFPIPTGAERNETNVIRAE